MHYLIKGFAASIGALAYCFEIRNDVAELKAVVEEIKWGLRGFIHFSKRKKQSEEENIKNKAEYLDCVNELRERFKNE